MEGNVGNIITFYFPVQKLGALVGQSKFDKNGVIGGKYVEFLCSDKRLGDKIFGEPSVAEQIVTVINNELGKASIRINATTKGVITGVGFGWQFQNLSSNKVPEPSVTWKIQIVSACAKKLAEYGYEFSSESRDQNASTFYFVEKRAVLTGLLG